MTKHEDNVYLRHIMDAIVKIEEYIKNISEENFLESTLVQDGVIRQLEIIGEATKRLSEQTRQRHNSIPWKDIAGMRDKLAHDYLGVDLDAVWSTVNTDIPALKEQIADILSE